MTRRVVLAFSFFAALAWAVPAMAQTTQKFQQGTGGYSGAMDTYIDGIAPNDTQWYGNADRIEIRSWGGGASEKMNILIKFDVSTIPSTATITAAKLTLYNTRSRLSNGDTVVLEKVTSAWNNQSTWSMGVPSVVAAPGVTCPTCTPVPPYTQDLPVGATPTETYVITGMAALVQSWLATPALNYGVMLSTTTDVNFRFASSEYGTVSVRPELEVTFTSGTPPPTATVTAPPATSSSSPIAVSGTASAVAPATVASVTWLNVTSGASGTASGTTAWTASIPLVTGSNTITITVTDSTGATGTTTFTVFYAPPPRTSKVGGEDNPCGFGSTTPPGAWSAALGLLLLLAATVFARKG